jgi:hypothetical protein
VSGFKEHLIVTCSEAREQGCQMVYFQTKNPDLGKFWRVLEWKMLVYFTVIWYILKVYFVAIWYIFPRLGMLHLEKSGNPAQENPINLRRYNCEQFCLLRNPEF